MKRSLIKIISLLVIVVFITQMSEISLAASKSELKNKQTSLTSKIKQAQQELKKIKEEKSTALDEVEELIAEISDFEADINKLDGQIDKLNQKIGVAQTNLNKAIKEYDAQEKLLNERLVLMYEDGETSYLDFMLSSDGLTDFISNYYLVSELTKYDSELLEQIQKKKQKIEDQKTKLEKSQKELKTVRTNKQKKQLAMRNAKIRKAAYAEKLSDQEKSTQKELEQYEADKRAVTSQLSAIAAREAAKANYTLSAPSANGYIFPVAGCSRANIRNKAYPSYRGHTGIDVSIGVSGRPVVAVKSGTVVISTALRSSGGGYRSYGEYVVINHHDGTMTLYAHMVAGSRTVSTGQSVSQGQKIGLVGSTGNSTGPHLHFEVRIGGHPVNPMPYLP